MSAKSVTQSTADLLSNLPIRPKARRKNNVNEISTEFLKMLNIFSKKTRFQHKHLTAVTGPKRSKNSMLVVSKAREPRGKGKRKTIFSDKEPMVIDLSKANEPPPDASLPEKDSLDADQLEGLKWEECPPISPVQSKKNSNKTPLPTNKLAEPSLSRRKPCQNTPTDIVHTVMTWEPPIISTAPKINLLDIRHSSLVPSEPSSLRCFPKKKPIQAKNTIKLTKESRNSSSAARCRTFTRVRPSDNSLGQCKDNSATSQKNLLDNVTPDPRNTSLRPPSKDTESSSASTVNHLNQQRWASGLNNPLLSIPRKFDKVFDSTNPHQPRGMQTTANNSIKSKKTVAKRQYRGKVLPGTFKIFEDISRPTSGHYSKLFVGAANTEVSSQSFNEFTKTMMNEDPVLNRLLSKSSLTEAREIADRKTQRSAFSDWARRVDPGGALETEKLKGKLSFDHIYTPINKVSIGIQTSPANSPSPPHETEDSREPFSHMNDETFKNSDRCISSLGGKIKDNVQIPKPHEDKAKGPTNDHVDISEVSAFTGTATTPANCHPKLQHRERQTPNATVSLSGMEAVLEAGSFLLSGVLPNGFHNNSMNNGNFKPYPYADLSMQIENSDDPVEDEHFSPPKPTTVIYFKSEPALDDENCENYSDERLLLEMPSEDTLEIGRDATNPLIDCVKEEMVPEETVPSEKVQKPNESIDAVVRIKEEILDENELNFSESGNSSCDISTGKKPPRGSAIHTQSEPRTGNEYMVHAIESPSFNDLRATASSTQPQIKIELESEDESIMDTTNEGRISKEITADFSKDRTEEIDSLDVSIMIKTEIESDTEDQSKAMNTDNSKREISPDSLPRSEPRAELRNALISSSNVPVNKRGEKKETKILLGGTNDEVLKNHSEGKCVSNLVHSENGMNSTYVNESDLSLVKTEDDIEYNNKMDTDDYSDNNSAIDDFFMMESQNESETCNLELEESGSEKNNTTHSLGEFEDGSENRQENSNGGSMSGICKDETLGASLILSRLNQEKVELKGFSFDAFEQPKPFIVRKSAKPVETSDQQSQTETVSALMWEPLMSYEQLTDTKLIFFTGINKLKFSLLHGFLFSDRRIITHRFLSEENQLLLTLFHYRHKPGHEYLSVLFAISVYQVGRILFKVTQKFRDAVKDDSYWTMKSYMCSVSLVMECHDFMAHILQAANQEDPSELS
ncbi:uncharacterized protein [Bemisia tabaci]|uniref:uncharacterized protein n=1 Tax=Bemisia tabaci TaxID=7038 RepID=UPI003B2861B6